MPRAPVILSAIALAVASPPSRAADPTPVTLVLHGGAGTIRRQAITPADEAEIRAALAEALAAGQRLLLAGGSALDAVEQSLRVLEDSPRFNAGRGAVFNAAGAIELDAAIMDGATRAAGAVAAVTTVRHPISAARAVLESSPHVLLVGPGADAFAAWAGLEIVDPSFFATERRLQELRREQAKAGSVPGAAFGTVGAVALDAAGRLAAGTTTGGRTNKLPGRVGDSPILGAGTWADDRCAVSATGHGEFFIRWAVAHDLCARVRYQGLTVAAAGERIVLEELPAVGADGGLIALGADGTFALPFNTEGMYRGWVRGDAEPHIELYR